MASQFGAVTLVDYAGARWRVQRVLGVETVLLRSDTGEEIAADPLKIQLPKVTTASKPQISPVNEPRYSDADWAAATRRRDCIAELAANPTRTTSAVTTAAAALGLSPRRIWSLLRQMESAGAALPSSYRRGAKQGGSG